MYIKIIYHCMSLLDKKWLIMSKLEILIGSYQDIFYKHTRRSFFLNEKTATKMVWKMNKKRNNNKIMSNLYKCC